MKYKIVLLFTILAAVVTGGLLGELCANRPYIGWLAYGKTFGFDAVSIDLQVIDLTFGLHFSMNILQLLFLLIAIVVAPRIAKAIQTSEGGAARSAGK